MRIVYTGPAPERELWGRVFQRGEAQDLSASEFERQMAQKALRLEGFALADAKTDASPEPVKRKPGRPRKVQHGEDQG